jgi:hypothetical protein
MRSIEGTSQSTFLPAEIIAQTALQLQFQDSSSWGMGSLAQDGAKTPCLSSSLLILSGCKVGGDFTLRWASIVVQDKS